MLKKLLLIIILNLMVSGIRCQSLEEDLWACKDGHHIPDHKVCNGYKDCSDGSDEFMGNSVISSPCLEEECSSFNARCHYGACIPLDSWCNGIADCADNSDEWKQNCNKNGKPNELSCESGEFILEELFCDGKADCEDKSDENELYCSLKQCNASQFRCQYGGCIDRSKRCNGKIDCVDKSDESSFYANCQPRPSKLAPKMSVGCMIPFDPNHDILNENENVHWTSGYLVDVETRISIKCRKNYSLSTSTSQEIRICGSNGWNYDIPKCFKFCDADLLNRSRSTIVECKYDSAPVRCTNIKPNTVAVISCADSYQMPLRMRQDIAFMYTMICTQDSKWDIKKVNCEPICGIIDGDATASEAPWLVRIKAQDIDVCGGTIISPNHVITALHCFFDENDEVLDARYVQVKAGVNIRNGKISKIEKDITHIYAHRSHDVALLKLRKPFILSKHIRPICYTFATSEIASNLTGFINIWPSRISQGHLLFGQTAIQTLSRSDCNADMTDDQFCVRPTGRMVNNVNRKGQLCQGDSGSGVIEQRNGKHYLIGIISYKPSRTFPCTKDPVVAVDLTKIPASLKRQIDSDVEDLFED